MAEIDGGSDVRGQAFFIPDFTFSQRKMVCVDKI